MDLAATKQKFKELKRTCKDIEIEDRKLIETQKKPKVYSAKDLEDENIIVEDEASDQEEFRNIGSDLFNTPLYIFEARKKEKIDKTSDSLAKRTYDKEIKDITKFRSRESEKSDKLDELVNHLNSDSQKRYKVQKKKNVHNDLLAGGFINDKNKQFNSKISKERESNRDK